MPTIYTSYFANRKKLDNAGIAMVSISLYTPDWFNGLELKDVAPTREILFGCKDNPSLYEERYKAEVLSMVNPVDFVNKIYALCPGMNVALCCYEKPSEFCHRHIVAKWLNDAGYNVREYKEETKQDNNSVPLF